MGQHSAPELSTQSRYPWRATLRTVVAFLIAILPYVAAALSDASAEAQGGAAIAALPIIMAITRFLARPEVDALLKQYLPPLATTPKER